MHHLSFLRSILFLSLTSFGGPQGHLIQILRVFTKPPYNYAEADIIELNAFCQLLPGASTTQLICLLAYRQGGIVTSFFSLLIWIFPTSFIMCMLAILLSNGILTGLSSTTFNLFQPMVIAFLINATFKSYPHLCRSKHHTIIVAVLSLLILLFFKQPFIIPLSFLVAGFYGYHFIENSRSSIPVRFQTRIKSRFFILFITLFIISGFLSELARKADFRNRYYFNLIEHNYRFGSLTFGGGDVLIPLLYEQYVTRPTSPVVKRKNPDVLKIEKQDLLAGAGFIRLMPGPIFSITSFVSVFLMKDMPISAQLFGSLLSTFAIFIPGFLIILFFYPLWINVKSVDKFSGIIQGVNLSVLSIMVASSIYLTVDIFRYGMLNELNPALILLQLTTILLLLRYTNVPSFVIAVGCLCYGLI